MTRDEFIQHQERMGLSNSELAAWLGMTRDGVQRIKSGRTQRVPGPVAKALQLHQAASRLVSKLPRTPDTPLFVEIEKLRGEL